MDMSGIASIYSSSGSSAAVAPKKELGKEDFLQLFTTQLRAQNPLKPMDSTEFTSQMAQFSSPEQLTNINTNPIICCCSRIRPRTYRPRA